MSAPQSLFSLRVQQAAIRMIRWPFALWPRWTRVEIWAAGRLADIDRRWFGWDDE